MAQHLEITEIRNYPLSNGTTVDLVALIDNGAPADWRTPVIEELAVGQVAYVSALGEMRRGVITKLGRTKVHVTFTTQGAIDHQARYQKDAGIRVQTTAAAASEIRVAPFTAPLTGDNVDQEMETPDETAEREAAEDARNAELDQQAASEERDVTAWQEGQRAIKAADELLADLSAKELENPDETAEREAEQEELEGLLPEGAEVSPEGELVLAEPVTGSAIVAVLEQTWEAIRANHPELPHVVIVTGSGFVGSPRWAHWRESGWTERADAEAIDRSVNRHGEMFVAGETLARGAAHTVESMLHEGAHALATKREVQDTSRQGRWHNGQFRKLAEELGLSFTGDKADPTHGFSNMLLTPETRERYAELIERLDKAILATINVPAFVSTGGQQAGGEFVHGGKRPKAEGSGSSTNNLKLTCKCVDEDGNDKPRIIRASKAVAEAGQMLCTKCDEYFEDRS